MFGLRGPASSWHIQYQLEEQRCRSQRRFQNSSVLSGTRPRLVKKLRWNIHFYPPGQLLASFTGYIQRFPVSPPPLGNTNPGVPQLAASVYTDSSVKQPCTLPTLYPNIMPGRHIGTKTIIINHVSVIIMPYLPNAYCAVEAVQNPVKFLFWWLLFPWKGNRDTERILK